MGLFTVPIIALRNEKGSYNKIGAVFVGLSIIALRNEKGSYNCNACVPIDAPNYSTAK